MIREAGIYLLNFVGAFVAVVVWEILKMIWKEIEDDF